MSAFEIPSREWPVFCQKFTSVNRGSLLAVELRETSGRQSELVRDLPLDRIEFRKTDGCNDEILLVAGQMGGKQVSYLIVEPIHLTVRQNGEGRKLLQIDAENGTTLITFHSGRFPEPPPASKTLPGRNGANERNA